MGLTIAVTGKGGVGKTAFSALAVLILVEHGCRPLLAVDADPNLNLDGALGLRADETVGGVREEAGRRRGSPQPSLTIAEFLEYQIRQSLVESGGFDLIAMGRPEGPGCYCYANEILRNVVDRLASDYAAIVIDCEAGLEHLSRRTTGNVDWLIALSDPTVRGLQTARRALDLVNELHTQVGNTKVVVNRVHGEPAQDLVDSAERLELEIAGWLPEDPQLTALDGAGRPLSELPADSPFRAAVAKMLSEWGLTGPR